MLHSDTEECSSQLKSQLKPHKEHKCLDLIKQFKQRQLITHREDILLQVYRNDNNPDMTSPVTMATCLISSYLTYVPS
jgi:hypothetical protein